MRAATVALWASAALLAALLGLPGARGSLPAPALYAAGSAAVTVLLYALASPDVLALAAELGAPGLRLARSPREWHERYVDEAKLLHEPIEDYAGEPPEVVGEEGMKRIDQLFKLFMYDRDLELLREALRRRLPREVYKEFVDDTMLDFFGF